MQMQGYLGYSKMRYVLIAMALLCISFFVYHLVSAATITTYSDRLSDSAPGVSANHTIILPLP